MNQELFDQLTKQSESTITAKVICDSVNPDGVRLTTMEWTYPRFIHSEIMTHRALSRNAASSRAIPLAKMIERVETNPVFPLHWGKNQKGMQAEEELSPQDRLRAADNWICARNDAILRALQFNTLGIHKQIANRILEPWMWITVVVSATNFENLFALRCHKDAEPHFQNLAYKIREVLDFSTPKALEWEEWHLPYFWNNGGGEHDNINHPSDWPKISAARCGRVSYLTQDGVRDCRADYALYERLAASIPLHASPLEHPSQAVRPMKNKWPNSWWMYEEGNWGNFEPGWLQFRKMHPNENITKRV